MRFIKRMALPIFGLIVGLIFFFPWNSVKDIILGQVAKATGIQIQMQNFSPTLGLRIGITTGSVLGFSGTKASVRMQGNSLACDELIVGPRIWPLFIGQAHVGVGCLTKDGGKLAALVKKSLFGDTMGAYVGLTNFSLENVELQAQGQPVDLRGVFTGTIDVTDINVATGGLPNATFELDANNVRTPEVNDPAIKLPGIDMGPVQISGNLTPRKITVSSFQFGTGQTIMEGKIKFNSDIEEESARMTSGEMAGTLRIDPSAENGSLRHAFSWKTVFGAPDADGRRQFKKSFTNGPMSLIFSFPGT